MSSCDTCGSPTDEAAVIMTLLGVSTGSTYIECPPCALERAEDEEHGAKIVSIGKEVDPERTRLSYGLKRSTTTWADGLGFRTRHWRHGGSQKG